MGQFFILQFLGFCFFGRFWAFLGILGYFCYFLGFSGGLVVSGVLVSYKITRGTILVVGRVNDWV